MNYKLILLTIVIISLSFNRCDPKAERRELTKDNIHSFLKDNEKDRILRAFNSGLDSIYYHFKNNNIDEHIAYSSAVVGYLNGIPAPFQSFLCQSFMKRIEKDGIQPYLSVYIELGKRMLWFQSKESLKCYDAMKTKYEASIFKSKDFKAAFTNFRDIHIISEDLVIAIGSILFSRIGENIGINGISLEQYIEMINYAANCSNCGEENQNGATPFSQTRDIVAQSYREVNYTFGRATESDKATTPCDQINTIFSNQMTDIGASNLCVSANNSKKNGGINERLGCFVGITTTYFSEQKSDMWDNVRLFEQYVQCMNSDFFDTKPRDDISYYMSDGETQNDPEDGTEEDNSPKCEKISCRPLGVSGTVSAKPQGVGVSGSISTHVARMCDYYDENCNHVGTSTTIITGHQWTETKQSDGSVVKTFTSPWSNSTITTRIDKDGVVSETYNRDDHEYEKEISGYYKKINGRWVTISKEEYESNKPWINPSPDNPAGNCGYMFEDNPPWIELDPVTGDIKGIIEQNLPWINPGPEGELIGGILGDIGAYLKEIEQCLSNQTFAKKCLTNLMCVPDDDIDQCTCLESNIPSLQHGNCDDLVRCPEGTVKQGCACISPDTGEIFPGIGSGIGPWTALLKHLEFPLQTQ